MRTSARGRQRHGARPTRLEVSEATSVHSTFFPDSICLPQRLRQIAVALVNVIVIMNLTVSIWPCSKVSNVDSNISFYGFRRIFSIINLCVDVADGLSQQSRS